LYLAKVTGLFKNLRISKILNTVFKIPTVNSGVVVAAIHVAGVRCDPYGAVQRIVGVGNNNSLHSGSFCCNMLRLMYKKPSSDN